MAKKKQNAETKRVQVLVDGGLAAKIEELGTCLERSQSWMAKELICEALKNRQQIADWVALQITRSFKEVVEPAYVPTGKTVYLQTQLTVETIEELEELAKRLNHTVSKMAALLLESAVRDHDWLIQIGGVVGRTLLNLEGLIAKWKKQPAAE